MVSHPNKISRLFPFVVLKKSTKNIKGQISKGSHPNSKFNGLELGIKVNMQEMQILRTHH